MAEKPEKKPNYQKKKNRKPRVTCVRNAAFAKDVRINLRKAKFKPKRVSNPESVESEERLPAPQPKIRLFPYEESEKDEESEEEFLNYVKLSVSDDRNYDLKDKQNCSLGCCKSCGLSSHDWTVLNRNAKSNTHNESKDDEKHLSTNELIDILSSSKRTQNDKDNASGSSKTLGFDKTTKPNTQESSKDENLEKPSIEKLESEIENLEDDLEFLLKLKEPVVSKFTKISEISTSKLKEPSFKSATVPTKSVDLEKWLESVLDV